MRDRSAQPEAVHLGRLEVSCVDERFSAKCKAPAANPVAALFFSDTCPRGPYAASPLAVPCGRLAGRRARLRRSRLGDRPDSVAAWRSAQRETVSSLTQYLPLTPGPALSRTFSQAYPVGHWQSESLAPSESQRQVQ